MPSNAQRRGTTHYVLALAAGALSSVGVLFPAFFLVSALGFALFISLLIRRGRTSRETLLLAISYGFAYCGGVHWWLWDILPLDWLGIQTAAYGFLLIFFYWSTIAFFFGAVIAIFAIAYVRFRPQAPLQDALFAASLWTLVQYLQMWETSLVTAGSGSLFGAHYSTVMIGYALTDIPFALHIARFGGIFAMTFVFVFIVVLALSVILRWSRDRMFGIESYALASIVSIFVAGPLLLVVGSASEKTVDVALVSTNFELRSPYTPDDMVDVVRSMIENDVSSSNTLYILPEEISFLDGEPDDPLLQRLDDARSAVMFSEVVPVENGRRVRMSMYKNGTMSGFYDKMLLSPQGEYGPWFYKVWLYAFGNPELVEASEKNYTFERGTETRITHFAEVGIGALFCSDILSPHLYRRLSREGAQMLVESTSLAWFHSSPILDSVMLSIARVRAAENGRYLVIAGNVTSSAVISDTGSVIERTGPGNFSILRASIPVITEETPYTRFGTTLLLFPLLGIVVWFSIRPRVKSLNLG